VGEPTTVPEVEGSSRDPAIAWTGDGFGVVWSSSGSTGDQIRFARLDVDGRRVGPDAVVFGADGVTPQAPGIAWDGRRFGVSWWRSGQGVDFSLLESDGRTVGDVVRLTESPRAWAPSPVAANAQGFVVAWADFAADGGDVFVAHVGADGEREGEPADLTPGAETGGSPALASTSAGFGLVFPGGPGGTALRFARLDAGGRPTGPPLPVARREANTVGGPALAWTGRGYIAAWEWQDAYTGVREVHAVAIDEAGRASGEPFQVSPSGGQSFRAAAGAGGGAALVAWNDDRDGVAAVLAATVGEDGTASEARRVTGPSGPWEDGRSPVLAAGRGPDDAACAAMVAEGRPARMIVPLGDGVRPVLAATGDGYGLAWTGERGGNEGVRLLRLDDLGRPRGEVRLVAAADAEDVALEWTGDGFGAAWTDHRDPSGFADNEIYFARLDAAGAPSGEPVRVTHDDTRSEGARLAWSGREFGLAWADVADDGGDRVRILFRRLSAGGQPVDEGRVIAEASAEARPALVRDGEGYGVAWHVHSEGENHIRLARLAADGSLRDEVVPVAEERAVGPASVDLAWTGGRYVVAWSKVLVPDAGEAGALHLAAVDAGGRPTDLIDLSERAAGASSMTAGGAGVDVALVAGRGMLLLRLGGGEANDLQERPWPDNLPLVVADVVWTGREYAVAGASALGGPSRVYFARVCP
jgi:hypothetical protein